jgi:Polysaccharide pyruvyl transferase
MRISLFDPGLENQLGSSSANLGDLIIQEAVMRELNWLFKDSQISHIATHDFPTPQQLFSTLTTPLVFVGGTNLISSRMDHYMQWKTTFLQKAWVGKAILLGVGWQTYQVKPNFYSRWSLRAVLSRRFLHSVRDSYTQSQLQLAGIHNVINTGCPTMWALQDVRPDEIPAQKSENALVMLTDYSKRPESDRRFLELVGSKYKRVYAWAQGRGDEAYLTELANSLELPIQMIDHSYEDFQNFLKSEIQFDYIGTRLHGGVKCWLCKRRSLVIAIDNRAIEIAKDTNLPTVEREDLAGIEAWIEGSHRLDLRLNTTAIAQWKSQFKRFKEQGR